MNSWKHFLLFLSLLASLVRQRDCRKTYTAAVETSTAAATDDSKRSKDGYPSGISTDAKEIQFILYCRPESTDFKKILTLDDEKKFYSNSSYSYNKSLIIVIPGIESSPDNPQVQGLKNALLTTKEVFVDSNIVVVNWEKLSNFQKPEQRFLLYPVAINNGELVALKIIRFIRHAITAKALEGLEDVHLIGIGVGAGIATYVAKNINRISKLTGKELHGKIGRLSGLDPAGVFFTLTAHPDMTMKDTTKNTVNFMDIYHTDQGRIGIVGSFGHVDFFPNGGSFQPECNKMGTTSPRSSGGAPEKEYKNPFVEFSNWVLGLCGHFKAIDYFKMSITDKFYQGCKCPTIIDMECMRTCNDSVTFGYFCPSNARGNYQVIIPRTFESEVIQAYKRQMQSDEDV